MTHDDQFWPDDLAPERLQLGVHPDRVPMQDIRRPAHLQDLDPAVSSLFGITLQDIDRPGRIHAFVDQADGGRDGILGAGYHRGRTRKVVRDGRSRKRWTLCPESTKDERGLVVEPRVLSSKVRRQPGSTLDELVRTTYIGLNLFIFWMLGRAHVHLQCG